MENYALKTFFHFTVYVKNISRFCFFPSHLKYILTIWFSASQGGRWKIRVQVRLRPRGLVLHGLPRQSAARAEDRPGASDQRGRHRTAVALRWEHGVRSRRRLLQPPPLQRGLRLLNTERREKLSDFSLIFFSVIPQDKEEVHFMDKE